ncbi:hypothetical protein K443DRAFT_95624, partial [Laccaria amethystina LaAM-08-1]
LVLIKFVQWYLIKLHYFCVKSGCAPWILAFERLPSGWYAVVMDILSLESKSLAHPCFMLNNKTIVYKFYMEDLVHSDLQTVNILCREDSVIVIVLD